MTYTTDERTGSLPNASERPNASPGELVFRREAAQRLGLSVPTFKRREAKGLIVSASTNARGWKLYSPSYLASLTFEEDAPQFETKAEHEPKRYEAAQPRSPVPSQASPSAYDVDTARRVFDALDRHGEDLVRIVKEQAIHPHVVQAAHSVWLALKKASGGFHVSGDEARAVAELDFDGLPVKSGAQLVAFLKMLDAERRRAPCASCGQAPREPADACFGCRRDLELRREREMRELREQRDEARSKVRAARRAS